MDSSLNDRGAFRPTRWSLVARASTPTHPQARAALAELCQDCWYPLYAFARRRGFSAPDAEDLTQSFFAFLIEKNTLAAAEASRGKLRTFLLAAFQNHLADTAKHDQAAKRGGKVQVLSLDQATAEQCYALESAEHDTPETLYNRRWAISLLERALDQLEAERIAEGHGATIEVLRPFLSLTVSGSASYADAAARLAWTLNATRVAVYRLRRRYRELLLEQIATTLEEESPAALETEMRALLAALD